HAMETASGFPPAARCASPLPAAAPPSHGAEWMRPAPDVRRRRCARREESPFPARARASSGETLDPRPQRVQDHTARGAQRRDVAGPAEQEGGAQRAENAGELRTRSVDARLLMGA